MYALNNNAMHAVLHKVMYACVYLSYPNIGTDVTTLPLVKLYDVIIIKLVFVAG